MTIGSMVSAKPDMTGSFETLKSLGLSSCQVCCWDMELVRDAQAARGIRAAGERAGVPVSTFWCGWSGDKTWNFIDGPRTLGLIAPETRARRVDDLRAGAAFARELGVGQMATHMGFLPECPNDPLYEPVIAAVRDVALACAENGQRLLFETGQETPVTLLRVIEDVGTGNLGVNFDAGNLLLYGKANPLDALDIIGNYVFDTHLKDGEYPTDGRNLGVEKRFGEGRADLPAIIRKLAGMGYQGALTIEREITGEKQLEDIRYAKSCIKRVLASL